MSCKDVQNKNGKYFQERNKYEFHVQEGLLQQNQHHNIQTSRELSQYQKQQENSSFELENNCIEPEQKKDQTETIHKVLNKLGLNNRIKQEEICNEQLQVVVENVVENCLGTTINNRQNIIDYQVIYNSQYNRKIKQNITPSTSIFISQFKDIQNISQLSQKGLWGVYKYIKFFLKKISIICAAIVGHFLFQSFILLIIILNSIKMAFDDPMNPSQQNSTIQNIFISLYTIQMMIKIFAFGFLFNSQAYLRDPWNIIDFVIVSTSLLPLVVSIQFSVNSLRAIRVLRPLKTITKIKALKMIVSTLFNSFSLVLDSLYILIFVMIVFAIAGTQLFSGLLKNRCMQLSTGTLTDKLCEKSSFCGEGFKCVRGIENPNFSINNFDTFLWSMLSVFRSLTMEGWSDIMISLQRVYSPYAFIYSILIVFFCEYVLLNMTLAILKYKYSQVKGNTIEEQEKQKDEYQPNYLKKLGIFKQISKLQPQAPLTRYNCSDKIFVGARWFNQSLSNQNQQNQINESDFIKSSKNIRNNQSEKKLRKSTKEKININQLHNIGKIDDHKWDVQGLTFQKVQLNEMDQEQQEQDLANDKITQEYIENKSIISEQSQLSNVYGRQHQQDESIRQDLISYQLNQVNNRIQYQKKPQFIKTTRIIPTVVHKQLTVNKQISQLDNILKLISKLSLHEEKQQINSIKYFKQKNQVDKSSILIPDIDINEIEVERLYNKFNDLGQYRLKRIQRRNQLDYFEIKHHKIQHVEHQNVKKNVYQEIMQQNTLDLKELQLVNELIKKKLKCRIKSKDMLLQQAEGNEFHFDQCRVLVSQMLKETEKIQKKLQQNVKNLIFTINYKFIQTTDKQLKIQNSLFHRLLKQEQSELKLPQRIEANQIIKNERKQTINNEEKSNYYLKLLQSHQMNHKIELQQQRITQVYFKNNIKQINPNFSRNLKNQSKIIKQDDIFHRHGHLNLYLPIKSILNPSIYDQINIKPEQYEIYVKGFIGIIQVIRKKILLFISKGFYDNLMLLLVICNTAILALNGLIDTTDPTFLQLSMAFTFIFAIDLLLKIFAFGSDFFGDIMNLFDGFVVGISIVDVTLGGSQTNLSALRAVRILRAFRVLRITRLIRTLNYMKIVLSVVSSVITQFVYIFMLMTLFIFIYTLLGMQIFGGTFLPQSITGIRQNFNSLFNAIFSVFQVLTVENWNDIETLVLTSSSGIFSVFYLISWIFIGNWILLNLLQAILLDGFDKDSSLLDEDEGQEKNDNENENKKNEQIDNSTSSLSGNQQEHQYSAQDASLFIFLPSSYIRIITIKICNSNYFQNFIILMIALSSIKLVIDTYLEPGNPLAHIANMIDIAFNVVFILQSCLKIISQGFILGQNSYLKSSWSKLDFLIVITAIIDMTVSDVDLSILKLFRTLRPLRIISRNPDMKVIIASLGQSMLGIFNVIIIIICIFLMFGILGINLLQGKLNFCNQSAELKHGFFGPYEVNQQTCQSLGGVWTTQFINFDNIFNSLLSLYVFSTRQNWPFYVYTFFDADQNGPKKDASQLIFMLYSVCIIFICSYFFMDLLVGVLFLNFHEAESRIKPKTLTDKQINWQNLQKIIIQQDPCFELYLEPNNPIRYFVHFFSHYVQFYRIVACQPFEIFITFCIVANISTMMVNQNDQNPLTTQILQWLNFAFSIVFITEMVLKLLAYSKGYFYSGWNIFDFFVVLASILDIILDVAGAKSDQSAALSILPQIARIFRVLRITRLLRMFKRFKGLQKLIETFIFSLPALGKGLSIVCLFLFISSVLASYLFGTIKSDFAGNFDQWRNFSNFHQSLELLFIITTGQNWYFYMFESIQQGYVTCSTSVDCTNSFYLIFWLFYVFFSQKVFMQLFVLIVLDQFQANYINQNNPLGIFSLFEEDFRMNWIHVAAKYRSAKIDSKKLIDLLLVLKQPLGLGKNQLMQTFQKQLRENKKLTQEEIHTSLSDFDIKLKKNATILLHRMKIMKNRMYFGYHETFYHFAKLSMLSQFYDSSTIKQKQALQSIHKQSQRKLQELKPEGNLYYSEQNNVKEVKQNTLNPIQLILCCQMIIKSWHNYSERYHFDEKRLKNSNHNNSINNSLNESCSSNLRQAELQKLPNNRRMAQRVGILQKMSQTSQQIQFIQMPKVNEHYQEQILKAKLKSQHRQNINKQLNLNQNQFFIDNKKIK